MCTIEPPTGKAAGDPARMPYPQKNPAVSHWVRGVDPPLLAPAQAISATRIASLDLVRAAVFEGRIPFLAVLSIKATADLRACCAVSASSAA